MAVTLQSVLGCSTPKMEKVELPGDEVYVYVKEMTSGERDEYLRSMAKAREDGGLPAHAQAKLLATTLVGDDGARISPGDEGWKKLKDLPSHIADKLSDVAQRINGMGPRQPDELKNSETTESEDSASV
jgi:hypothetical protein